MVDFSTARDTIAIVGAGFSGTVLAAALLRRPPAAPTDIVLIERASEMGRGVAYAAREFPYLLNVPAGRLSADAADPGQFLRFAQRRAPRITGEDFLSRELYGAYLQDVLAQAERSAPGDVRLVRVFGEVRRISPGGAGLLLEIAGQPGVSAARVVLALGNPPPGLQPWAEAIREHKAYRHDPWGLPTDLAARHSVLIVGNGLTMADAVSVLTQDPARAPMLHAISRRGLVPLLQTEFRPSALRGDGEALLGQAHSLRRLLEMSRQLAREVEHRGGDWREVVTFVRHLAPTLWQRLPAGERRRFMRHLQAQWDVHRHRMPPQLGARIDSLRRGGSLRIHAGRIEAVTEAGEQLRISWSPRGRHDDRKVSLTVDLIVNATGPDYALARSTDPLQRSLRAAGMICEDELEIGLRTGPHGECIGSDGRITPRLYYLGPMLRAAFWEATAATELRDHADALAAHLATAP
ncbi:MAG TPA: FAD/NAD(P)-binding protein [Steroidobacteraceae bacterium]|nr:FAD/NAD(P)-binding protein [Steroidobacteraceae bacterium]